MSEIIKLYENVGIEKRLLCGDRDVLCGHVRPDGKSRLVFGCFGCEYKNDNYPPFTPEKQLELIKWLSQYTYRNYIKFRFDICGLWYCECNMSNSDMHHTFEDALIDVLMQIWQDLTDQEKEEIRRILE